VVEGTGGVYSYAARMAENETGILNVFPESCPWDFEQIMNSEFWPE
jgi:hypothetical protein